MKQYNRNVWKFFFQQKKEEVLHAIHIIDTTKIVNIVEGILFTLATLATIIIVILFIGIIIYAILNFTGNIELFYNHVNVSYKGKIPTSTLRQVFDCGMLGFVAIVLLGLCSIPFIFIGAQIIKFLGWIKDNWQLAKSRAEAELLKDKPQYEKLIIEFPKLDYCLIDESFGFVQWYWCPSPALKVYNKGKTK